MKPALTFSGHCTSGFTGRVVAAWHSAHEVCSWQAAQVAAFVFAIWPCVRRKSPACLKSATGFSG